jgi:transposase
MLTLSPAVRIYLETGATDLRRSIDGLAALVRERFTLDPLSGHLFLFRNRRGDRIKILAWDRGGFWVLYKRLERGTFAWPVADDVARVEVRSAAPRRGPRRPSGQQPPPDMLRARNTLIAHVSWGATASVTFEYNNAAGPVNPPKRGSRALAQGPRAATLVLFAGNDRSAPARRGRCAPAIDRAGIVRAGGYARSFPALKNTREYF